MTAFASLEVRPEPVLVQAANAHFLGMLDSIKSVARFAFRHHSVRRRQELLAEVVAGAFVVFHRLVELRKTHLAYPTVLAKYAIRRIRARRPIGVPENAKDALSPFAQLRHGFLVGPLQEMARRGDWQELVVEDCKTAPAELGSFRVDFAAWLRRLPPRARVIALDLAADTAAMDVAQQVGVTRARISQVRRELETNWTTYQAVPKAVLVFISIRGLTRGPPSGGPLALSL